MIYQRLLFLITITCLLSCSSRARLAKKERRIHTNILTHNYSDIVQKSYCGDEPIVRFVDFTFDKNDSLKIDINITTSVREKKITGSMSILLDEYEIEYSSDPISKLYVETLEVESQNRYPTPFRGRISLTNLIIRSSASKGRRKQSGKQYWNSVSLIIEHEDVALIQESKEVRFLIKTENCVLDVYPSIRQIGELRRFLR